MTQFDKPLGGDNEDPGDPGIADATVERWLLEAKAGDLQGLRKLRCWAYACAQRYFRVRSIRERFLDGDDVEEMASAFFMEFEASWPRAQSITRFTRFLLATWVGRYLKKKRELSRREQVVDLDMHVAVEPSEKPWRTWDDTSWARYRALLVTFAATDENTRELVVGRLTTPPRPYRDLAVDLRSTESALRMRMTRFNKAVRRAYETSAPVGGPWLKELPRLEDLLGAESDSGEDS